MHNMPTLFLYNRAVEKAIIHRSKQMWKYVVGTNKQLINSMVADRHMRGVSLLAGRHNAHTHIAFAGRHRACKPVGRGNMKNPPALLTAPAPAAATTGRQSDLVFNRLWVNLTSKYDSKYL